MLGEDVLLDIHDGVATVALNRPGKMNALSDGIKQGIEEALDEVSERDDARCVVLTGTENAFCAGGDVGSMDDRSESGPSGHGDVRRLIDSSERIPIRIYEFECPTVAKIDGYCLGAGVGLAMACDVLLASERAKFGLVFRNIGLSLDYTTSLLVTRAVGPYVAKELAFTGDIISADHAEELGLINHTYPTDEFDAEVDELVGRIADGPTVALHHSARCIDRAHNSSLRETAEREANAQNIARNTLDHEEGLTAFSEDRDPSFEGM